MKYDHKMLESNLPKKKYSKVLEIGPGFHSHINYLNHDYDNYYIIEKEKNKLLFHKKIQNKKIKLLKYKKNKIPFKKNFFDRIIMSHVLEHISNPEKFIEEAMEKLKKGGVFSIALPTDPALLWRMGRLFSKIFFIKKNRIFQAKNTII